MSGNAGEAGRSVLSRAMAVLGAFDETHRELTATEAAERAALPLSTTHRLLTELVGHGALTRRDDRYGVGHRMWSLGLLAPVQTGLRDVAAPFLQDIHATTLATVHLAVRDATTVLYLDRLSGNRSVPVVSKVGSHLPLHATGVGKVLLAYAPAEVRDAVLADLTRVTPYTVTHVGRLSDQLRRVREQGYATTSEEMTLGACSVAVPVVRGAAYRSAAPEVVAAIGLVVPVIGRHRQRLVAVLQVAARGIGRQLDAPTPPAQWEAGGAAGRTSA